MKTSKTIQRFGGLFLILVALALLAGTYFYWQPYDKCLIQAASNSDKTIILDFISRIIYYLLYFSALLFILLSIFKSKNNIIRQNKVEYIKTVLYLFAIRIVFDIISYSINKIIPDDTSAKLINFAFVESVFNVIVIIMIFYKFTLNTYAKMTILRKVYIAVSAIISMFVVCFVAVSYIKSKKIIESNILADEYNIYILNMIRDIVINFSAIFVLYGLFEQRKQTVEKPFKEFSLVLLRFLLIMAVFLLLNFVKFIVLPQSMIKEISSIDGVLTDIERIVSYEDAYQPDDWF